MCVWGGADKKEQFCLISSLPVSSHFPPLPTSKVGPFGAASWLGGFVHALGPCGSPQQTLLWGWEFLLLLPQPPRVFSIKGLRLYFPELELWVLWFILLPSCSSWFICTQMWDHPVHNLLPAQVHQLPPCLESSLSSCLSPPHLLVWVNVSSLTPWLLEFHTVWFSVNSGGFLFLNLLSCKEAQCVHLRLHLGQKSKTFFSSNATSTGFDEFWSQRVRRYDCTLAFSSPKLIYSPKQSQYHDQT